MVRRSLISLAFFLGNRKETFLLLLAGDDLVLDGPFEHRRAPPVISLLREARLDHLPSALGPLLNGLGHACGGEEVLQAPRF